MTDHLSFHRWRLAGSLLLWGSAVFGALELRNLPVDFGHGICGPWGCGPPLQVLLACHAFWIVNLTAVFWICASRASAASLSHLANAAIFAGVAGLVGVAVWQQFWWWPRVSEWARPYVVQRYVFTLATLVDVPIIEILLFGVAGSFLSRRQRSLAANSETEQSVFGTDDT